MPASPGEGLFWKFIKLAWSGGDHKTLGAVRSDPAFQAHWEAYMLLVAITTWRAEIISSGAKLVVKGDAQGVLQSVIHRRAKNTTINMIVGEMQLKLGRAFQDITAVHFWSEDNELCDRLSRLFDRTPAKFPTELAEAHESTFQRLDWTLLK